jgi:hypothetical protein
MPLVLRTPTHVRTVSNQWQSILRTSVGATQFTQCGLANRNPAAAKRILEHCRAHSSEYRQAPFATMVPVRLGYQKSSAAWLTEIQPIFRITPDTIPNTRTLRA